MTLIAVVSIDDHEHSREGLTLNSGNRLSLRTSIFLIVTVDLDSPPAINHPERFRLAPDNTHRLKKHVPFMNDQRSFVLVGYGTYLAATYKV